MRHRGAVFLIAWGLPAALGYARADDMVAISNFKALSGTPLFLDYSQGHIDAQITAIPLRRVLHELSAKTGLQTRVNDPRIGDYPVTSTLQAMPLAAAIAELLDGFSYAMSVAGATSTLSVLSTPPKPKRLPVARAIAPAASQGELPAPDTPADEGETGGPESLEEFEPISMEEPLTASSEGEEASSADNPAHDETVLQRALNALGSKHKDLHPYAIEQLADLKDPRATQALIDLALNGTEQTPEVRRRAVAALSRHADTASTNALKRSPRAATKRCARSQARRCRPYRQPLQPGPVASRAGFHALKNVNFSQNSRSSCALIRP